MWESLVILPITLIDETMRRCWLPCSCGRKGGCVGQEGRGGGKRDKMGVSEGVEGGKDDVGGGNRSSGRRKRGG